MRINTVNTMFNTTTLGFALVGFHPHPKIKASTASTCSLYSEGMGLSCSLAYNGTADFLCTNFVCFKEKSSALSSLALEPTKKLCFSGFSSSSQNKASTASTCSLYSEGMGFEPTVELLPHNLSKIAP